MEIRLMTTQVEIKNCGQKAIHVVQGSNVNPHYLETTGKVTPAEQKYEVKAGETLTVYAHSDNFFRVREKPPRVFSVEFMSNFDGTQMLPEELTKSILEDAAQALIKAENLGDDAVVTYTQFNNQWKVSIS